MAFYAFIFGPIDVPTPDDRPPRGPRPDGVRIVRRPQPVRAGEART
jgi:hypothetical protein